MMNNIMQSAKVALVALLMLLISACDSSGAFGEKESSGVGEFASIEISPKGVTTKGTSQLTVITGNEQAFTAIGFSENGESHDITSLVTWSSSEPEKAEVNLESAGVLKGMAKGSTTVMATMGETNSNTIPLMVVDVMIVAIQVTPGSSDMPQGTNLELTAMATYNDNTTADITSSASWSSANETTATVVDGVVTAVLAAADAVTITATQDGINGTATVTVTDATMDGLQLTPALTGVPNGIRDSEEVVVTATYSDGSTLDVTDLVSWNEVDTTIATIAEEASTSKWHITGASVGRTTVSASLDGMTSNTGDIVVTDAVLNKIEVTPAASQTIAKGTNVQLKATGTFSDTTTEDLTSSVVWTNPDDSIAKIDSLGSVVGNDTGTVDFSASKVNTMNETITSNSVEVVVNDAAITSIQVTPSVIELAKGEVQQLTAVAFYTDGTHSDITKDAAWVLDPVGSSDVTINSDGLLTAEKANSTTKFTANYKTDGNDSSIQSNEGEATVNDAVITDIVIDIETVSLAKGQTAALKATATYSDGTTGDITSSAYWISDDAEVVTVSMSGELTGASAGSATVMVSKDGVDSSNSSEVTVSDKALTAIVVAPADVDVPVGVTETLVAMATYSDGTTADISSEVNWSAEQVSGEILASIGTDGVLTGVAVGDTTFKATKVDHFTNDTITSNSGDVTVSNAVVTKIEIEEMVSIVKGGEHQLAAMVTYSDGKPAVDMSDEVTWVSTQTSIATVTVGINGGNVFGVAAGGSTVTATLDGVTSNLSTVSVSGKVISEIAITPSTVSVENGNSQQLTATATYSDGSTGDITDAAQWTSGDDSVVTVAKGNITGIAETTTPVTITATQAGVSSDDTLQSAEITVSKAVIKSIKITPELASLPIAGTEQFKAMATFSDGTEEDITSTATWAVSDGTGHAIVDSAGLVTAKLTGIASITATQAGITSNLGSVVVAGTTLDSITVTPTTDEIAQGTRVQLEAIGHFSDGSSEDMSSMVDWTSSNTANDIAVIDAHGLVTGKKADATAVEFTAEKVGIQSNTAEILVTAASIVSIQVTPSVINIAVGQIEPLTAIATYTDGSSANITDDVDWTSDAVATALFTDDNSNKGELKGAAAGSTTFKASKGSVESNQGTVTVSDATINEIQITPANITIAKGGTHQYKALAIYSDGSSTDITDTIYWHSDNLESSAILSNDTSNPGLLFGVDVGSANVLASLNSVVSNSSKVTVTDKEIDELVITAAVNVAIGVSEQLVATAVYSDGTTADVTSVVSWSAIEDTIATITADGVLKGEKEGDKPFTASINDSVTGTTVTSNTATVTVSSAVRTKIVIAPSSLDIPLGTTYEKLMATAHYSDGVTTSDVTDDVTWTSTFTDIATVTMLVADGSGHVQGVKQGHTTVSAQLDGMTSENNSVITVTNATISKIELSETEVTLPTGSRTQLTATATYSDGSTVDVTTSATWDIDNNTLATVDKGIIVANLTNGETTVKASLDSVDSADSKVIVTGAVIESISLDPAISSIPLKGTVTLTAKATYSDGTEATICTLDGDCNWVVTSDNSAVSVSGVGVVTGAVLGTASITATKDGITSDASAVTVTGAFIESIAVTPSTASIAEGKTEKLKAIATYSDGTSKDISSWVTWDSPDSNTVLVSTPGIATGVKQAADSVSVTATASGLNDIAVVGQSDITVTAAELTTIIVTPEVFSLPLGKTQQLNAKGVYSNSSTQVDITDSVTWVPVDGSVIEFGTISGLLTAKKVGITTITAEMDSITSNIVGMAATEAVITSIVVTPSPVSLAKGAIKQLSVTATYSDSSTADVTDMASWVSGDDATATVSSTGSVKGIVEGDTTATATVGTLDSPAVTVTVGAAEMVSIQLTPAQVTVPMGMGEIYIATAVNSDGTTADITSSVVWNNSNPKVGAIMTFAGQGLASAASVGETKFKAIFKGVTSNEATFTVTAATIKEIQVTPATVTLAEGGTQQLKAEATYTDNTTRDVTASVTWTSDDEDVATIFNSATVSEKGKLIAQKAGSTNVEASLDGVTSNSATVTVSTAVITDLQLTPSSLTIAQGATKPLIAMATYSDGSTAEVTDSVTWNTDDALTATASADGAILGVAKGSTTVSASIKVGSDTVTSNSSAITVTDAVITAVQITPADSNIAKGNTENLTIKATYSDGTSEDFTVSEVSTLVSLVSNDTDVATVTADGEVEGIIAGKITVTATLNADTTITDKATVKVSDAVIASIQITPASNSLAEGQNQQLTAIATYSDSTTADITSSASWSSTDTAIATVTDGLVVGIATDPTAINITATKDSITSNNASVTVTGAAMTSIQVTPALVALAKGNSQQLTATAYYSDGTDSDITATASWVSVDTDTATITAAGVIEGAEAGVTTFTAADSGITSNTADVTVSDAVIESIQITPSTIPLAKGNEQQMTATATYSDGSTADITSSASWKSDDTSTATLTSGGLLTGIAANATTISATQAGIDSNTANVTVSAAEVIAVQVTPPLVSIYEGSDQQLEAIATYSDATSADVTSTASWKSMDTATATITAAGLLNGVAVDETTFTATYDSVVSNEASVVVKEAIISTIVVTPAPVSIAKGQIVQLKATATYNDGSTEDITSSATWASDDTTVATIVSGLVSGIKVDSTTVTASKAGVTSADADITVTSAVVVDIEVTPKVVDIPLATTKQMAAKATYSDGTTSDVTSSVSWKSIDTNVATITTAGVLTGAKVYETTLLSATLDGVTSNEVGVLVTGAIITSIEVTPLSIGLVDTEQLTAIATYSDGSTSDITSTASWAVDDTNVATAASGGLLTAVSTDGSDTTTVTASQDSVTSNIVDISILVPVSMKVLPAYVPFGYAGEMKSQQLEAEATYSDGSTRNVTSVVAWASGDDTIATVNPTTGLAARPATNVKVDLTQMTASYRGLTASTDVRVYPPICGQTENTLPGTHADGGVNHASTTPAGECTKVADFTQTDGSKAWVMSSPSEAAVIKMGYKVQDTADNSGRTYGVPRVEGVSIARFRNDGDGYEASTAAGGQYDRWCSDLAAVNYSDRSNWRRLTYDENVQVVTDRGNMKTNYGWPVSHAQWTSTPADPPYQLTQFKMSDMATSYSMVYPVAFASFVSCMSEN